jgi:hypothetical protein
MRGDFGCLAMARMHPEIGMNLFLLYEHLAVMSIGPSERASSSVQARAETKRAQDDLMQLALGAIL